MNLLSYFYLEQNVLPSQNISPLRHFVLRLLCPRRDAAKQRYVQLKGRISLLINYYSTRLLAFLVVVVEVSDDRFLSICSSADDDSPGLLSQKTDCWHHGHGWHLGCSRRTQSHGVRTDRSPPPPPLSLPPLLVGVATKACIVLRLHKTNSAIFDNIIRYYCLAISSCRRRRSGSEFTLPLCQRLLKRSVAKHLLLLDLL